MRPVKKVEIVITSVDLKKLLKKLDQLGVSGYTVMRDVEGKGDRGERLGDELTNVLSNSYVMVCCTEPVAEAIAKEIQPLITRIGGMCLISDAIWVRHRNKPLDEEP